MSRIIRFIKRYFETFQKISFYLSVLAIIMMIYDYGFYHTVDQHNWINYFYEISILFGILSTVLRYILHKKKLRIAVRIFDALSLLFFIYVLLTALLVHESVWILAVFLVFIREFSHLQITYGSSTINPAQLFIFSFLVIIIIGAGLLMLPRSTHHGGLNLLDALFTSTSAVCVTGLSVVDVSKEFTLMGQTVLVVLIQIGGLGIMTFASYFSYFFRGASSYQNQLTLGELTNDNNLGEVFSTVTKIVAVTLGIEMVGAILIYLNITPEQIGDNNPFFFSLFHSISAFCNAGFSTVSGGLYYEPLRFNYNLQLIIGFLIIFGGLGFPIVFNITKYIRYRIRNKFRKIQHKEPLKRKPWLLNINSRITIITTFTLIIIGFITFFVFEFNNTLKEASFGGKFVGAFFGAVTPRTAGFNTVDMANLSFPTIMIYFLLMWVGASPASTGGGIKTTTFAVATLNFISLAKGKNRIEVFRREISDISVRRAFATISLSLIVIGTAICIMESIEYDKGLLSVAFECFSAYSTVGLSLGITEDLGSASRVILIFVMFIGRVSMLSILIALMKKEKYKNYRYPSEDIIIN